jgi:hypothetical protein
LSKRLESINLVKELRRSFEAERAFGAEIIDLIARKPSILPSLADGTGGGGDEVAALGMLFPRGWWYFEAVNHSRAFDDYMLSVLPEKPEDLDVEAIKTTYAELERQIDNLGPVSALLQHRVLAKLLLPALGRAAMRSVQAQTLIDQLVVALALERSFQDSNSYPEALGSLTAFGGGKLPNDSITQEPFRYERVQPDSYRLWSVGWNQEDDGGVVAVRERRPDEVDPDQGDWVWPSADGVRSKVFKE